MDKLKVGIVGLNRGGRHAYVAQFSRNLLVNAVCDLNLEKAKALPCVFNNWAMFMNGEFVTVNLPDAAAIRRLLAKRDAESGH